MSKLLNEFLMCFKSVHGRSIRTCREYEKCLIEIFSWISQNQHNEKQELDFYRAITKRDMILFITHCDIDLKNSAERRCCKISAARAFFQYLLENDYLDKNVMLAVPRPKRTIPSVRYLSLVESVTLLKSANEDPRTFYRERNLCILTIFLNCGLRLSELTNIEIKNIEHDSITFTGKGNKIRTVPLNVATRDAINAYFRIRPKARTDNLFVSVQGEPLKSNAIATIVKVAIRKAKLDSELSAHKLRHTAATLMYRYGNADIRVIQGVLGHDSIQSTQRYTHVDPIQARNAINSNPLASFAM